MGTQGSEIARLLRKCSLFSDLGEADGEKLASHAKRRNYKTGDPIFHAGDPGDSLMGVLQGTVRISQTGPDGGEIILTDLSVGDVLGEIALLDGRGRSADALALTNCELVSLHRDDFIPFLKERPSLFVTLLSILCERVRSADERSSDLLFLDLAARLAKALLNLGGNTSGQGKTARISLTQGDLAKSIGVTRSSVNRQLKEWERAGIIQLKKGWIIVADPDQLSGLATSAGG